MDHDWRYHEVADGRFVRRTRQPMCDRCGKVYDRDVEGISGTNCDGERPMIDLDQHFTPGPLAQRITQWANETVPMMRARILEPSAGDGAIAKALALAGAKVTAVEIDPVLAAGLEQWAEERRGMVDMEVVCADFMRWVPKHRFDAAVMNPPYSDDGTGEERDTQHVRRALDFAPDVWALVRLNFLTGWNRQLRVYRSQTLYGVRVLTRRPKFSRAAGSPRHDFAVVRLGPLVEAGWVDFAWWDEHWGDDE